MREMVLKTRRPGLAPYFLRRCAGFAGQRLGVSALAARACGRGSSAMKAVSALDVMSIQARSSTAARSEGTAESFLRRSQKSVGISDRVVVASARWSVGGGDEIFHHPIHPYTEALHQRDPDHGYRRREGVVDRGRHPQPGESAEGLQVPYALQILHGDLHAGRSGVGRGSPEPLRRLPPQT